MTLVTLNLVMQKGIRAHGIHLQHNFHQINYYQGWRERGGGRLAPSLGEVSSPDLGVELGEAESDPFSRCLTLLDIFLLNLTSSALREEGREVSWTEWWWKTGTSEGTRRCWNRQ